MLSHGCVDSYSYLAIKPKQEVNVPSINTERRPENTKTTATATFQNMHPFNMVDLSDFIVPICTCVGLLQAIPWISR